MSAFVCVNIYGYFDLSHFDVKTIISANVVLLQGTVNTIGLAYDHLHDELKTLVVFADNPYTSEQESFEKKSAPYAERKSFLDSYMQSSFEVEDKDIDVKPSVRNKSEQMSSLFKVIPKIYKNATTLKTPMLRNVNIQKCDHVSVKTSRSRNSKVDKYIDLAFPLEDKYVQYEPRSPCKIVAGKDATTRTRYPLKSTGAETKPEYSTYNRKTRPGCASKSGRSTSSRYHEKCVPEYYYHRY